MEALRPYLAGHNPVVLFSTGAVTAITFVWLVGRIFGPPKRKWSRAINQGKPGVEGPTHRHILCNELIERPELLDPSPSTLYELAVAAAKRFPNNNYQGFRPLLKTHEEQKEATVGEKKEIKKWTYYELGHYQWETYADFARHAKDIGSGLVASGAVPGKTHIGIFCSTRPEWLQVAHGAFSQAMSVATVYANLGEEGLIFAIQECAIEILFTSADLLPTVNKICKSCPTLKIVIFVDNEPNAAKIVPSLKTIPLPELEALGKEKNLPPSPPKPEDLAVIMYTSGSTGAPKGVVITHRNLVAAAAGAAKNVYWIRPDDVYLAFLPLAHVLELMVENAIMCFGAAMGYGGIRTISDANVRNCKSDIGELRPTVMAAVPTVWEMIRKSALAKVEASGAVTRTLFGIAIKVNTTYHRGGGIPVVHFLLSKLFNVVVFRKFHAIVGGRLRAMVAGGAPLSSETQAFMRACMGVPFLQGYGLTESCGMCSVQPYDHKLDKCVGAIMPCSEVKLVDVPEMGYTSSSNPQRGEIWIRGPAIAKGYYKNQAKTDEAFKDGWLLTGDVGEWHEDGTLSVIDRIKNLVKMSHGEYIALEKLESVYKDCPFVQNICVYGDGEREFPIAIVFPFAKAVHNWADRNGEKGNFHELCESPKLAAAILTSLQDAAKTGKLKGIEVVQRVIVTADEWTPENDMLTAAMKLKRANIVAKFKPRIAEAYKSKN